MKKTNKVNVYIEFFNYCGLMCTSSSLIIAERFRAKI